MTPAPPRPDRNLSDQPAAHAGHEIVIRTPDMAGRPVVICMTCNVRLIGAP